MKIQKLNGTTAVPKDLSGIPLRYAVIVHSDENPEAKAMVAMFAMEDDRDAYVAAYNKDDDDDGEDPSLG